MHANTTPRHTDTDASPQGAVDEPSPVTTLERAARLRAIFDEELARRGLPPLSDSAGDDVR